MQKKLLSLLMVTTCGIMYGENTPTVKNNEKVPKISQEEHVKNKSRFEVLEKELGEDKSAIEKKRAERDALEIAQYRYTQRNIYRQTMVEQLSAKQDKDSKNITILNYHAKSKNATQDAGNEMRKKDNGIQLTGVFASVFAGLTPPAEGSASDIEYKRIERMVTLQNEVDDKLLYEHAQYGNKIEAEILPFIDQELLKKDNTIHDVYIATFIRCHECKKNPDEYMSCLSGEGVSREAATENFVETFFGRVFQAAYARVSKDGIPLTQEEIIAIAASNPKTRATVAKVAATKERCKKAIKGELPEQQPKILSDNSGEKQEQKTPTQNPPASKPNITTPDKK